MDAVEGEVRQAQGVVEAEGLSFADARTGDSPNLNELDDDELDALIERDEGNDPVGDQVNRTHRLKLTGNGVVPACAYVFAAAIRNLIELRGLPCDQ